MFPSLRVVVFGITRSGKDYSISSAIKALKEFGIFFEHFSGISTVRDYSESVLGKPFSLTTVDEKGLLMDIFRKNISDRSSIPCLIQDEHYSFPVLYGGKPLNNEYTDAKFPFVLKKGRGNREYEVMFKEEWISDSDMIFYLDPDSDVILSRIRSSEGNKRNIQITEDDVEEWKKFEIDSLNEICIRCGIRFNVIKMNEGANEMILREICTVMIDS